MIENYQYYIGGAVIGVVGFLSFGKVVHWAHAALMRILHPSRGGGGGGALASDAPVIAISRDVAWHAKLNLSTMHYDVCFTRAGAQVKIVSPDDIDMTADRATKIAAIEEILDEVDGVLVAAGGDAGEWAYKDHSDDDELHGVDSDRDFFDWHLIKGALARNMPLHGVCRGHQMINAVCGGKLTTAVRDDETLNARHGPGLRSLDAHAVELVPAAAGDAADRLDEVTFDTMPRGSSDAEQSEKETEGGATSTVGGVERALRASTAALSFDDAAQRHVIRVSSFHGSAVAVPGRGFRVAARCPDDDVIEATENPHYRHCVTTQFHPEFPPYTMEGFFDALVQKALQYRRALRK